MARQVPRAIITCFAVSFFLLSHAFDVVAQPDQHATNAESALQSASMRMYAIRSFFGRHTEDHSVPYNAPEVERVYGEVEQLVSIFEEFAPRFIVDEARRRVIDIFVHQSGQRQLAQLGSKRTTILEAVHQCQLHCSAFIVWLVTGSIATSLADAQQHLAAVRQFGPAQDNPAFYAAVKPPASAIDFLKNIVFAYEHWALLREDFYTLENMCRTFGCEPSDIRRTFRGGFAASWTGEVNDKTVSAGAASFARTAYSLLRVSGYPQLQSTESARDRSGDLFVGFSDNDAIAPSFSQVQQVFGRNWRADDEKPLRLDDRKGPGSITYSNGIRLDDGEVRVRRLQFTFATGGSLFGLKMTEENVQSSR